MNELLLRKNIMKKADKDRRERTDAWEETKET